MCAGRRQDNRAAERADRHMCTGMRFFADDEDEHGLEDVLQARAPARHRSTCKKAMHFCHPSPIHPSQVPSASHSAALLGFPCLKAQAGHVGHACILSSLVNGRPTPSDGCKRRLRTLARQHASMQADGVWVRDSSWAPPALNPMHACPVSACNHMQKACRAQATGGGGAGGVLPRGRRSLGASQALGAAHPRALGTRRCERPAGGRAAAPLAAGSQQRRRTRRPPGQC